MARPLRIEVPDGIYHVTSRGLERRNVSGQVLKSAFSAMPSRAGGDGEIQISRRDPTIPKWWTAASLGGARRHNATSLRVAAASEIDTPQRRRRRCQ